VQNIVVTNHYWKNVQYEIIVEW